MPCFIAINVAARLAEPQAPWAVLYLTLAHKTVLCKKVQHRLNPKDDVVRPSPFIYAMQ